MNTPKKIDNYKELKNSSKTHKTDEITKNVIKDEEIYKELKEKIAQIIEKAVFGKQDRTSEGIALELWNFILKEVIPMAERIGSEKATGIKIREIK